MNRIIVAGLLLACFVHGSEINLDISLGAGYLPSSHNIVKRNVNDATKEASKSETCTLQTDHDANPVPWSKKQLTWALKYYLNGDILLDKEAQRAAIAAAAGKWAAVSSVTFKEVQPTENPDIELGWLFGNHQDGMIFRNHAAHAYSSPVGVLHFNADKLWTSKPSKPIAKRTSRDADLDFWALHGLGHVIGLKHSSVVGAIMNSKERYFEQGKTMDLHADDIQKIQALYPKPTVPPTVAPVTKPDGGSGGKTTPDGSSGGGGGVTKKPDGGTGKPIPGCDPCASYRAQEWTTSQAFSIYFQTCITEKYGIKADAKRTSLATIPAINTKTGTIRLGSAEMRRDSDNIAVFYRRYSLAKCSDGWQTIKTKYFNKGLIWMTAARYVHVTDLLYQASINPDTKKPGMDPCQTKVVSNREVIVIPTQGACYPPPVGGATQTSDYDVGLVGTNSGYIVAKFNELFKIQFAGRTSEFVYDTNVYAFSLEYAMPTLFTHTAQNKKLIIDMTNKPKYKMQDLVSAMYKIQKYGIKRKPADPVSVRDSMYSDLNKVIDSAVKGRNQATADKRSWLSLVNLWDTKTKPILLQDLRSKQKTVYQSLVKSVSSQTKGDTLMPQYVTDVMIALTYAAEAYHSRGATRHVVGYMQMNRNPKAKPLKGLREDELTNIDLLVSMLENWGDAMKVFEECERERAPATKCVLAMSKYLHRTFAAMELIRKKYITNKPEQADMKCNIESKNNCGVKTQAYLKPGTATEVVRVQKSEDLANIWLGQKKAGTKNADTCSVKLMYNIYCCVPRTMGATDIIPNTCIANMWKLVKTYTGLLAQKIFVV